MPYQTANCILRRMAADNTVINYLHHHFEHCKIPVLRRCQHGIRCLTRTFEVPFCHYIPHLLNKPTADCIFSRSVRRLMLSHHHRSCSVKHLATEYVMVNYMSRRPVVNLPITRVSIWHTEPSMYLWCAALLLHSCMFGVWGAILWTSLHCDFNLNYCRIISCQGNVLLGKHLSGKRPVRETSWHCQAVLQARSCLKSGPAQQNSTQRAINPDRLT